MKFKKLTFFLIIASATLLSSCLSKQDKMNSFINEYNKAAASIVKNYVKSSKAEKINENEIKLTISLSIIPDETTTKMYTSMFPETIKEMIYSLKNSKELINDGVKFNFYLLANDGSVVVSQTYDKEYFNEQNKQSTGLLTESGDPDIHKLAVLMNKGLPLVDTVNGLTILKFELINDKEAQYVYLVPELTMDLLIQDEEIANSLKEDIISDPKQKNAMLNFFKLGIKKFNFVFSNNDRTKTKKFEYTIADLIKIL